MTQASLFAMAAALLAPLPAAAQAGEDAEAEDDARPILLYHPPQETIIIVQGGVLTPNDADRVADSILIRGGADAPGERTENLVRAIPGLAQFRRSDGRSANPTSQGLTLRGLGGNAASRVAVLLDAVPQADPFGGWINWGLFDALPIGGVRLVRGGSGAEGSGAMAGTLSLYSRMAREIEADAALGSRGGVDLRGAGGLDLGTGIVSLSGRYQSGDGFQPVRGASAGAADRRAPYRQWGGGLRAQIDTGNAGRLEVAVRGANDRRDRGLDFTQSEIGAIDASLRYLRDPTPYDGWQFSLLGYAQLRNFESQFAVLAPGRSTASPTLFQRVPALGYGLRAEIAPALPGGNPLRFGLDYRASRGATREQFTFTGLRPQRQRRAGGSSDIWGLRAEYGDIISRHRMTDSSLAVSARLDRWTLGEGRLTESDIGGVTRQDLPFASRTGWEPSARIGFGWTDQRLSLRSAAYRSWRLPTLNELYRPFRAGSDAVAANAALSPERLWGFETGIDYAGEPLSISATAYWNRLGGAVANVTQGSGPGVFPQVGFVAAGGRYLVRRNLDAIISRGVDVSAEYTGSWVTIQAAYAYVDARVDAPGAGLGQAVGLDGLRPAQVARHSATGSIKWQRSRAAAMLELRYAGAQFEDDQNRLRLKPAVTADLLASYRVSNRITALLRVENLLDAQLPVSLSGAGIVEQGPPRTLWFALRFGVE